jgi:AcrR family transcriptional regulator
LKEEIIETSLKQFLKYGIKKMTIQKLIKPMGVSTKTVYKYFSHKEELLKECLSLQYSRLFEKFAEIQSDEVSAVVTIFRMMYEAMKLDFGSNHIFYHDLNYYYPQLQDKVLKKYSNRYYKDFVQLVEKGIKQGHIKNDIMAEVVLEAITGMYASITRTQQFKRFKLSPFIIFKNTIEVYLKGTCTQKGLQELDKNYSIITK